ncbi:MAG: lipid II flippase MurJ [Acidobacteriota bacterium]
MKWKNIFRETAIISSIHLSTKILGFLEKILIAYVFGASSISDAYFFSFAVFIIIFDFFNESTSPALLPEYVKQKKTGEDRELFYSAFSYLITIGFVISILISIFSPFIINKLTNFPAETAMVTISYLRIISLGIGFVIASISTYLYINSNQKFFPASLGDLMFKITGSLFILFVLIDSSYGLLSLAIGITAGSFLKLFTHIVYLKRTGTGIRIKFGKNIKKIFRLSAPMVIGILFSKFRILFDNFIVSGMAVGSVTALQYGYRVMEFGIVVLLEPFSTVIFPEFVKLINNMNDFIKRISTGMKFLLTIFLPVSTITFIFRYEIISLLFKRGAFDEKDVAVTAAAFSFYALSMSFICIDFLLSRSLFSMGDTLFPAIFEVSSILFHIAFSIIFKSKGIHIISMAFLLNRILKSLLLFIRFRFMVKRPLGINVFLLKIVFFLAANTIIITLLKSPAAGLFGSGIPLFLILSSLFMLFYFIELYFSGILMQLINAVKKE